MKRPSVDTSTLLRVALLLIVVLLALKVVQAVLQVTFWFVFEALPVLLGLAVIAVIVLWLLDR